MTNDGTNGTFKVLVLEDEPSLKRSYERSFRVVSGIEVVYAANVNEARALLRDGYSPDGIVTDECMPEIKGSDFIPELRRSGFSGRIALASGDLADLVYDPIAKKVKPYDVGCFFKPFRPDCLPDGLLNYLRTGIMPEQK